MTAKITDMKKFSITGLIGIYFSALIGFALTGWIGWLGIILILLRSFGVTQWSWWIAALPLEYGAIYCLYMTIDGAKYRAGLKGAGKYASFTAPFLQEEGEDFQIHVIIKEGPEHIGETIDRLCKEPSRLKFNQALLDASLAHYYLLQLAMFADKNVNAYVTVKKWKESGLKLPEEGTSEFS